MTRLMANCCLRSRSWSRRNGGRRSSSILRTPARSIRDEFLNASRIDLAALRRSEDSFMDELIGDLEHRGFPVVRVHFPALLCRRKPRAYELDPRMFKGRLPSFANTRSMRVAGGLGTIPRVVGDGQEIYRERLSRRRRAGADRGALQALSPRAAPADQQSAPERSEPWSWWIAIRCPRSACRATSPGGRMS